MIITNQFVFINFPKTGTQFLRKQMDLLHSESTASAGTHSDASSSYKRLLLPNIRVNDRRFGKPDEHGAYSQIPHEHKSKTVVSIKRNLFQWWISLYEFRDWKQNMWVNQDYLEKQYPHFPNLSFADFVNLAYSQSPYQNHPQFSAPSFIGPASCSFILFYFKNPFDVLNRIDRAYIGSNQYTHDIAPVQFLENTNLNNDLYNLLLSSGYQEESIHFILDAKRINVSTPADTDIDDYFTPDLKQRVMDHEKLLFNIFGSYYV